jgi:phosphohistidine phosphatase
VAATLELYLVRHAVAAERGPDHPDDRKRPLTAEGLARWKQQVRGLRLLGVEIDHVLSSPLLRARQTADALAGGLARKPTVGETPSLAPGGGPAAVAAAVAAQARKHRRIALVGHEPDLGELAASLLKAKGAVEFRKGAVCRIDVDVATPGGPGVLRWFLTPKALRRMAR